ncbi:5-oxoprolinase subunit B family protein [Bradyrhizobium sp.]|jgi:KipI family sensor histidine kinase inhibitor|uniref:5-oxoprolinase subunit B family protein n=1 Tax=Bradyrhizobium sp. TaxID=376 RepID=UPI003D098800
MTLKVDPDPATASSAPRFLDAGEAALVVQFGDSVDPAINDRVLALDAALRADPPLGTREFVPTYRSLMIHYDPLQIDRDALVAVVCRATGVVAEGRGTPATWTLPCCYDPALAEDLDEAATILRLTRDQAVALHVQATYRIYMCGFTPGQAYLGGVPDGLVISRRPAPRPPHDAGAVLIGGGLCVVAPFAMPTGWYVIGRTPERLYAAERKDAFLIDAGDNLRFDPIDLATFRDLEQRAASGEIVARKSAV